MPTAVHLDSSSEQGFWYVLDRAIARTSGVVIGGPPPSTVFADVPRQTLLDALFESMAWHRAHERGSLYSVLNRAGLGGSPRRMYSGRNWRVLPGPASDGLSRA